MEIKLDTQTIELVGQHRLASDLLLAGLEVAFPARDRGVDLIVYADIHQEAGRFLAKPIQLKIASRRSFGIWKKYEKIYDLILVFVWHVDGVGDRETYALTYAESKAIGEAMGWTETASWKAGAYNTNNPGKELCGLLEPHRMTPEKWWEKVTGKAR